MLGTLSSDFCSGGVCSGSIIVILSAGYWKKYSFYTTNKFVVFSSDEEPSLTEREPVFSFRRHSVFLYGKYHLVWPEWKIHYQYVCIRWTYHFKDTQSSTPPLITLGPTPGIIAFFPVQITRAPQWSWTIVIFCFCFRINYYFVLWRYFSGKLVSNCLKLELYQASTLSELVLV